MVHWHALSAPTPDEVLIRDVVREALGAAGQIEIGSWHVRSSSYIVVSVHTRRPALQLIVKLERPGHGRDHHFESIAAIGQLVRAQSTVPVADLVACDITRTKWPWNVLIVTELPGQTWAQLYPQLSESERSAAQWHIGRAAALLHQLRFAAFGPIGLDGLVTDHGGALRALQRRALQRITTPAHRDIMLMLLERHAAAFASVSEPRLVHEDLNPFNLLFEVCSHEVVLTGVLDFESAWSGVAESDLAKLELWRLTRGSAVRAGYAALAEARDDDRAALRKRLLQLLWCLEFANEHRSSVHQSDTDHVCAQLGIPPITVSAQ